MKKNIFILSVVFVTVFFGQESKAWFFKQQQKLVVSQEELDKQLFIAMENMFGKTAEKLLEMGANPNAINENGEPALIEAIRSRQVFFIELLLNHPEIQIEATDNEGKTAFIYAVCLGNMPVIRHFNEKGVNINVKDNNGWAALKHAVSCDSIEVIQFLVEQEDLDVNIRDNKGRTVLFDFAYKIRFEEENFKIAQLFLKKGLEINATDEKGQTVLYPAGYYFKENFLNFLIDHGVDMDRRDHKGRTVLIDVTLLSKTQAMKILLERGADHKIADNKGRTVLDVAYSDDVKEILKSFGLFP